MDMTQENLIPRDAYQGISRIGAILMGTEEKLGDSVEDSQLSCQMKQSPLISLGRFSA